MSKLQFLLLIVLSTCEAEEVNLNFLQTDYDIKLDILKCTWYNKTYYKHFNMGLVWYNRTQRAINGSCEQLFDLENKLSASIQTYKMTSNEYRFFPITFTAHACAEYKRNSFSTRDMLSRFSNIEPCHLKKNVYYVKNLIPDYSKFPPHLPVGSYKVAVDFLFNSDVLVRFDFYARVVDKPTDWQKIPKLDRY